MSLAEVPPAAVAPIARQIADAEPDTTTCPGCGIRIGHVLARYDDYDLPAWMTPWLVVTDGGTARVLCEDCATDDGDAG